MLQVFEVHCLFSTVLTVAFFQEKVGMSFKFVCVCVFVCGHIFQFIKTLLLLILEGHTVSEKKHLNYNQSLSLLKKIVRKFYSDE